MTYIHCLLFVITSLSSFITNSLLLLGRILQCASAMLMNNNDYSCHIKAIKLVEPSYGESITPHHATNYT